MSSLLVLIAPNDPVIGALMIELVRAAGHQARVVRADETVEQAVERNRPDVVMLDCDHAECVDLLGTMAQSDASLVFFSGARSSAELERIARRHGVASFVLPNGPRLLDETLRKVAVPKG